MENVSGGSFVCELRGSLRQEPPYGVRTSCSNPRRVIGILQMPSLLGSSGLNMEEVSGGGLVCE
eukprot:8019269-Pyramimonas_sp.AAC.1